ncbi:MAG: TatD family hydrolase, partial [Pseudomonadota bacterium]
VFVAVAGAFAAVVASEVPAYAVDCQNPQCRVMVTFKKADELRDIFRRAPLDRILVETDAPYLAPPPFRGKRNEPAYVVKTAQVGAELFDLPLEAFAQATTDNFHRLFTKVPRADVAEAA